MTRRDTEWGERPRVVLEAEFPVQSVLRLAPRQPGLGNNLVYFVFPLTSQSIGRTRHNIRPAPPPAGFGGAAVADWPDAGKLLYDTAYKSLLKTQKLSAGSTMEKYL